MIPSFITLDNAIGTIQAGPRQLERLDEVSERLRRGEFHVAIEAAIPSRCIDGRRGTFPLAPNGAGGSETLLVADDLTHQSFSDGRSTADAYAALVASLRERGLPIGGHTDTGAHDAVSGCGANDKLEPIYRFIRTHGDVLRELTNGLGVSVSDASHRMIVANAQKRHAFSDGGEMLAVLRKAGDDTVDTLQGTHAEVVAVINLVAGTTLDRGALASEFGPEYGAFNVDAWSFAGAAEAVAGRPQDIPSLVVAATYYNLATAHVLCGPNMRLVVRR